MPRATRPKQPARKRLTPEQRRQETEALLRRHKIRHSQKLELGEEVTTSELIQIAKLEAALENLEQFQRLRELTRDLR